MGEIVMTISPINGSNNEFFKDKPSNIDEEEIDLYLEEDTISKETNIIDYYKANKERFRIIYNIVKDYLAISPSSTPSESTFSKVGDIITKKRNRLLPSTVKHLITLKSWKIINDEKLLQNDDLLNFNIENLDGDKEMDNNSILEEDYNSDTSRNSSNSSS